MFESITKKERLGVSRLALVVAVTAVAFGAQLVLFAGTVAKPLAGAIGDMRTTPAQLARANLPEFEEEIVVVAPYRPRRVLHARAAPLRRDAAWVAPQYVDAAVAHCPDR